MVEMSLGDADAAAVVAGKSDKKRGKYTWAEIEKHTEESDLWFVVNGKVYNGTPFLADHPGGGASILIVGGTDGNNRTRTKTNYGCPEHKMCEQAATRAMGTENTPRSSGRPATHTPMDKNQNS